MRFTAVIVVGGIAVATACGSSGGGGPGGTGGAGGEGTAQGFVDDYCNLVVQCCSASGTPAGSAKDCVSQLGIYLGSTTYTESIEGLGFGVVYDPTRGAACIQSMQGASGPSCLGSYNFDPACANVFSCSTLTSTKGAGESCACDGECIAPSGGRAVCYGGVLGADGGVQTAGTCVQLTPGTAGQAPCLMTIHPTGSETNRWLGSGPVPAQAALCDTSSGVWCDGTTQQCTPLAATGQSCNADWHCVATDHCPTPGNGSAGTCTALIADGASCAGATPYCQATSYCEPTSQTCQPKLPDGSPCKSAAACQGALCSFKSGSLTCGTKVPGSDICFL